MTATGSLVLVDSSIWIAVLRRSEKGAVETAQRVRELVAADRVALVGPIQLELLAGTRTDDEESLLRGTLTGLHYVSVLDDDWSAAGALGSRLRRVGYAVPNSDLLIAAIVIRAGMTLVHRDTHFEQIAHHSALVTESHLGR